MDILISSQYLDFKDIESPIKRQYDALNYIYINDIISYDHAILVSKSEYTLYDNLFWSDTVSEQGEFYEIDHSNQHVNKKYSDSDYYILLDIKMSNKINQYERRVYSFYTLVSNIGGFYEMIHII